MIRRPHSHRHRLPLVLLVVAALALTACAEPDSESGNEVLPGRVVDIPGTSLQQVLLTREAAGRVGIETAAVRTVGPTSAGALPALAVPLAAVLYDDDGATWTYTNPAPLTFVRVPIALRQVDGQTAVLSSGPPAGTAVVTVGAAELLGVEEGVSGE
jgi:hypothetical protein